MRWRERPEPPARPTVALTPVLGQRRTIARPMRGEGTDPMQPSLHLSLAIFDHEPAVAGSVQVWKGGATDLTTRTMIADPPRWLTIADRDPGPAPHPNARPPLKLWEAEQINPGDRRSPENAG